MLKIEQDEQIRFIAYLDRMHPNVLFTASTSAVHLSIWVASLMKKMGYRAGTPDIHIYEARGQYHGLFIEMKRPTTIMGGQGKASTVQKKFLIALIERGYKAVVCYGEREARQEFEQYMTLKRW